MSTYSVSNQQTPAIERNRLTVFFPFFAVIPHLIWNYLYGVATFIAVFVAWFAVVITGSYPAGIYNFVAGYMRSTRVCSPICTS